MSHLVSAVNTAKLLANRDDRISITILLMKLPIDTKISSYTKTPPHHRISFVSLEENKSLSAETNGDKKQILRFVESQRGPARDAVAEMIQSQNGRLAGFVVDMFCTPMIDVANELGVPTYLYIPCGAASLGLILHLQSLNDDQAGNLEDYEDSDVEIAIPTYANPVPAKVWPAPMLDKEFVRRFRESRGIIINTFLEFEPHADEKIQPIYPVGPMIQGGMSRSRSVRKSSSGWTNNLIHLWMFRER